MKLNTLWIAALLGASCRSTQPSAPPAPPPLPAGAVTVAALPPPPPAPAHASGRPEIRYYEISDA
ncbi:MAG: hypothetical protein EXS08_12225 [Planctomycetes bacterium]|nr:hypothetical protein [Planctomycetota bacterium]